MEQEILIIFGIFLMILVGFGIVYTLKEFHEMEEEPERYSPSLRSETVQVHED